MNHPEHLPGEQIQLPLLQQMGQVYRDNASRVVWHSHPGFEILFMLEGATAYEFKSGRTVELHGGELFVVPPNAVHRGKHDVRAPSRICGLALNPDSLRAWKNTSLTRKDLIRIGNSLSQAAMRVHPLSSSLRWIVKRLMDETDGFWNAREASGSAMLRTLICAALLDVERQILSPQQQPKEIVAAALEYLNEHYDQAVQISALAQHLGYSRSRTFELFKSQTGLTPNDYLQRVRTQKAQELLIKTRRSITDIALSVGFSSSQYFSTVFRRYAGHSPVAFRQMSAAPVPSKVGVSIEMPSQFFR